MASDLPVDILEEIFLRLDDAADLARASAACTSFHRVVSDGRFLRRWRSLQGRPVLGLLANDPSETALFHAAQPPRRSAQAVAGFEKAADFNFAFLQDPKSWGVCDVRDGHVLLTRCPNFRSMFEDLVVYDPLHRRHVQIPTIPSDLVPAGNEDDDDGYNNAITFDSPFLVPAVDDDGDESSSLLRFQVMCIALIKTEVVAFVFSSASRQWQRGASMDNPGYDWSKILWLWFRQHVNGCVCWPHNATNVMLVFDTREMKLWIVDLPHEGIGMYRMAVEAVDGRLGLIILKSKECTTMDLYSKAKDCQGIQQLEEWRHDCSIPIIPGFYFAMLTGVTEGYALLLGIPEDQHKRFIHTGKDPEEAHHFTLYLKTLLFEKLCVLEYDNTQRSFLYASFPPLFSSPSLKL